MIDLTRGMAQALYEAERMLGGPGSVEQWNSRFGEATIAALDEAGLIRRQPEWTGCLELTEQGERLHRALSRFSGDFAAVGRGVGRVDQRDVVSDEQWDRIRAAVQEGGHDVR